MNVHVDIQSASVEPVPDEDDIRHWITTALTEQTTGKELQVSVRLVDSEEMSALNETYRGKAGPTNVLSFPADLPEQVNVPLLGDIVICAPVVRAEAQAQNKSIEAHWAHMSVHGSLHLLGFDHIEEDDASVMEALETRILKKLNFACPYTDRQTPEYLS